MVAVASAFGLENHCCAQSVSEEVTALHKAEKVAVVGIAGVVVHCPAQGVLVSSVASNSRPPTGVSSFDSFLEGCMYDLEVLVE